MKDPRVAFLVYGDEKSGRNALTEEKYRKLALYFAEQGFTVDSVIYNDTIAPVLVTDLLRYRAILVWVNPIEQGGDRKKLDALLAQLSGQGCFVSAHPQTILKMGTKEVLFEIRETEFGGDTKLYASYEDFTKRFLSANEPAATRILKQYRGNGGNGVFKVDMSGVSRDRIGITHAKTGEKEEVITIEEFFALFETYFEAGGKLIDQEWNPHLINGMVRCYLSGSKVAGFGYQEINALYPSTASGQGYKTPSQRFYFSENCGLFRDLKNTMENRWLAQLQKITGVSDEMLPVIWDADFFINKINSASCCEKYSLCEINVSSVSPFPESAIPYIAEEVRKRISLFVN